MDMAKYLSDHKGIRLNEQQKQAIDAIEGPTLLLAVPGSGKTTVVVARCANMIINRGINPQNILTLTFSKAAAKDMEKRFHHLFGDRISTPRFMTIHSFGYQVVKYACKIKGEKMPVFIESTDSPVSKKHILRESYRRQNHKFIQEEKLEELSNHISYYKNNRISGHRDQKKWKSTIKNFEKIFQDYEEAKKKLRVIDFDDMLTNAYETIKNEYEISKTIRNRYGYVNVDESQDTSMLQHEMIRQLVRGHNNLFMVGDEDQSIYAFRAAYPKALLDFPKTYPKSQVLLMEKNYRSTKHIVTHSNRFIRQNKDRYEKEMFTDREKGTRIKSVVVREKNDQYLHVAKQLLQKSDNETCAVLYRNNLSGVAMAHCLKTANIPYYIKEEKSNFFHHWVIKDILYFMEFSMDLKNRSIFRKIYFKMNAYISKEMIAYVEKTDPKQNIFDCLLDNPKLFSYQKQKIREKKRQFEKMTAMPANKMIKYIVETIGYGDFLDAQGKNDKQELDPLRQRLNILQWVTDKAKTITEYKEQLASLQADMKQAKDREWPGIVSLMTVHSSKGLEYDRVYIVDLMEGIFPNSQNSDEMKESEGAMEEEIRLFYVAATRAKDSLELIGAKEMDRKKVETSRFVEAYMKKRK